MEIPAGGMVTNRTRSGSRRNDPPNLDTTFDHETFEPLDASVDQRAQLILTTVIAADTIDRMNRSLASSHTNEK